MLLVQFVLGAIIAAPADLAGAEKAIRAIESDVSEKLDSPEMWKDEKREKELVFILNLVGRVRPKAIEGILLEHLDYELGEEDAQRTVGERYPAVGAMIRVGIPAVPGLVRLLGSLDPNEGVDAKNADALGKQTKQKLIKRSLAVYCLREIYGQGGYGGLLAKQRIELEAKQATPKAKKLLSQALESTYLKE
jgi:hypothetical protein